MKYKTLLAGQNSAIIDDFFLRMSDDYDMMTTSTRNADLVRHLDLFEPDIFIYCINMNSYKDYNTIYFLKERLQKRKVPLAVIGSEEECKEFARVAVNAADIMLVKPLTAEAILKNINTFISKWKEDIKKSDEPADTKQQDLHLSQENTVKHERKHILIIDDDPIMLKLVNEQLRDNYDVATAISGKLALKFLEKKKTDLILLDYEMPVDNGPAVLEKLRANPETKNIPVVFLTGVSDREKIKEVLLMRPQGYLLKPIDFEKLIGLLKGILEN